MVDSAVVGARADDRAEGWAIVEGRAIPERGVGPVLGLDDLPEGLRCARHEERVLNLVVTFDGEILDRPPDAFEAGSGELPKGGPRLSP